MFDELNICLLLFIFLIWHIIMNDFDMLNQSCIPRVNSTRSWYIGLFIYCWSWVASILRIFASTFIRPFIFCFLLACFIYLTLCIVFLTMLSFPAFMQLNWLVFSLCFIIFFFLLRKIIPTPRT